MELKRDNLRVRVSWKRIPPCCMLVGLLLCMGFAGCSETNPNSQVAAMNNSNIRRVANLYMAYQLRHGTRGPENEEELRSFITNDMPDKKLEMMGVNKNQLDELFESESGSGEFEVVYGISGGLGANAAVVFSQPGSDGSRRVAFTNGPVETIDAERYEQLKGSPAASTEQPTVSNSAGADGSDG